MIEARNIKVTLGKTEILHGLDFFAKAGELTAIIGPNGSGKTTLLKAMIGEHAYSGSVTMNGINIANLKPWQFATMRAVLPQATTLSFPFTVREIVRLGLTTGISGDSGVPLEELPDLALEKVNLPGFAGRFYGELSGGEQQRVQLARVLCQVWEPILDGQPRWLFLDEPVSSLDIQHQLGIMKLARDYAECGGGVIAVMHDLNLTAMFADNVHIMREGKIAASGPPQKAINTKTLSGVFGCDLKVSATPPEGVVFVLPQSTLDAGDSLAQ
ncbi:MAG: heme ABC transporter ATP-binding protein [Rhizobiaceae bacterium]|nr:heme ABC transporter ATP-binding protein [Rhizobiaceae bacterium]